VKVDSRLWAGVGYLGMDYLGQDYLVMDYLIVDYLVVDYLIVDYSVLDYLVLDYSVLLLRLHWCPDWVWMRKYLVITTFLKYNQGND